MRYICCTMKQEGQNPFPVSGYAGPALFCNRQEETRQLLDNALNGINTTLLSIRRMGKTGLLEHTLRQWREKKKGIGIYIDIFDTESLRDFTNRVASAVLQAIPEKNPVWKTVMAFIKQLRPIISYDELTGQPQVSLSYSHSKQYENSLQSIFLFLERQNKHIVIAIDEFQQITNYPEKNMEALLRTQIQPLKNIRFIFSGSSPHLLTQMFHHTKRPFFSSANMLELHEIGEEEYETFITAQFNKSRRILHEEAIGFILEFTRRHTYYTQALCNKVFSTGENKITLPLVQFCAYELLKQNETVYFQYRTMLTANQWDMLKAIAKEEKMEQPNSKGILKKYSLGSSSVVQRSIDSLLTKELIYTRETENGKYYSVYDCFFSRWLEKY